LDRLPDYLDDDGPALWPWCKYCIATGYFIKNSVKLMKNGL
jgi:hypothetical protein